MSDVAEVLARVLCVRNHGTTITDWTGSNPCAACRTDAEAQAAALAPLFDAARREAVEQYAAWLPEWRDFSANEARTFADEQWPGEA